MTEPLLTVILPNLPPSVNSMYQMKRFARAGRVLAGLELRSDARKWVSDAQLFMPALQVDLDATGSTLYRTEIELHGQWRTKAGGIRTKDARNYEKLITDAVFSRYAINDALVWESLVRKVESPHREQVVVRIYTYNEEVNA